MRFIGMAKVVGHLEEYAVQLERDTVPHAMVGTPTLSVGRILGGISVNVVPPECSIEIDRRVIPGEDQAAVIDQVTAFLQDRLDFAFQMLPPWSEVGVLPDGSNTQLADRLMTHVELVVGRREQIGVPYGTNAAATAAAGVPTVVFGPRCNCAGSHEGRIGLRPAQLELASEILFRFLSTA